MANYKYTGQDNLEAMKEAKNYNQYLTDIVVKSLNKKKLSSPKIMDFGAGIGTYADLLFKKGYKVDCLEPDSTQRNILKKKGYKSYEEISDVKERYDLIYAFNVFEHIKDDGDVFKSVMELLNKNGIAIIYVPANKRLYCQMDDLVGHCRRYTVKDLKKLAQNKSFFIEKAHYCDPIGFFITLAYKTAGNKSGKITSNSVKLYDRVLFPVSRVMEKVTHPFFGKNALLIVKRIN
jgi:SAM-dependent methyltransferase